MKRILLLATATVLLANNLAAQDFQRKAGDWLVRAGAGVVDPKSNNLNLGPGTDLQVDSATALYINGTYMITDAIGIELLAASPFEHDIEIKGVGKVGSTKQLPPTLSIQWHTPSIGRLQPYLGLGVNYTVFFDESTEGALAGTNLSLKNSLGIAVQGGVDLYLNENWFVNFDLRWIDIETDAFVDGVGLGGVEIDPTVYALTVGYKF